MIASILQQLLALYFAMIYSWQLSSSEKSLVGKKIICISHGFNRFRFLFFIFFIFLSFSMTNVCLLSVYFVGYAKRMLYSEQPTVLLARRHLKTMLLINFENVNSILNIFQETHESFERPSNYLYLFKNHRQTFS